VELVGCLTYTRYLTVSNLFIYSFHFYPYSPHKPSPLHLLLAAVVHCFCLGESCHKNIKPLLSQVVIQMQIYEISAFPRVFASISLINSLRHHLRSPVSHALSRPLHSTQFVFAHIPSSGKSGDRTSWAFSDGSCRVCIRNGGLLPLSPRFVCPPSLCAICLCGPNLPAERTSCVCALVTFVYHFLIGNYLVSLDTIVSWIAEKLL